LGRASKYFILLCIFFFINLDAQTASDSTYVKGRTLFPDSTLIQNTLDYEINDNNGIFRADGQTEQGHFETQFLTSVKDNNDYTQANQVEIFTDLEESFNTGQLAIKYRLPEETNVKIKVRNVLGQEIATLENNTQRQGNYHTYWNYTNDHTINIANGVYIYTIQTDDSFTAKILNLRRRPRISPGNEKTIIRTKSARTAPENQRNLHHQLL
jgi:hypothetical protein